METFAVSDRFSLTKYGKAVFQLKMAVLSAFETAACLDKRIEWTFIEGRLLTRMEALLDLLEVEVILLAQVQQLLEGRKHGE